MQNWCSITQFQSSSNEREENPYSCSVLAWYFFSVMDYLIIFLSMVTVSLGACPEDWHQFNNSCYRVFEHRTTFDSALRHCAGYQGYLLSVRSERENSFVASLISKYLDNQYWIGVHFNITSGYWLDDGTEVTWSKWVGPKTPCPLMTGTTKWTSEKCSYFHQFICEYVPKEETNDREVTSSQTSPLSSETSTTVSETPPATKTLSTTTTTTITGTTAATTIKPFTPKRASSTMSISTQKTRENTVPTMDEVTTPEVIVINRKKNPGRTVTDNRPSAIGIGSIGVGVLVCVFLGVVLLDASKLWRDFAMFRHNVAEICRRFRQRKLEVPRKNVLTINDIIENEI